MYKSGFTLWIVLIFLFNFALVSQAQYSGGSGTQEEPYQISTVADWQKFTNTSSDWGKHFILTAELDLQGVTLSPVGTSYSQPFNGVFDGKGHIIRNVVINMPENDYVGLFGYEGRNGQIQNLGVEDIVITGRRYVGGLVGFNLGGTTTACHVNGAVSGEKSVGGLVGYNSGNLTASYTTGSVSSSGNNVGGIVGDNSGEITTCYSIASVRGNLWVGGLVGNNWDTISTCYSTGLVSGFQSVGGLVGNNCGEITACYSIASVTGYIWVGGLVGNNWCNINACFWNVETSGLSGSSGGKGLTTNQMKSSTIYQNAGWAGKVWIIDDGQDYPHLAWENTAGVTIPAPEPVPLLGSGTAEDPYQIWNASDFTLLSWHNSILEKYIALMTDIDLSGIMLYPIGDLGHFTGVFDGKSHTIRNAVIQQPNSDYVGLFAYLGQNGQIHNIHVEEIVINGRFYVGGLVGYNYVGSLSACNVTGSVNGDEIVGALVGESDSAGSLSACYATASVKGNYDVSGLVGVNFGSLTACYASSSINGSDDVGGLVGYNSDSSLSACYATGTINGNNYVGGLVGFDSFGILNECYTIAFVIGSGDHVGGLVGEDYRGRLTTCYATGNVSGNERVGGLVGYNRGGTLTACYATGSVNGYTFIGGLVGDSWGTLTACYATGSINGYAFIVGGLVGGNGGTITNCYATGSVDGDRMAGGLLGTNRYGSVTYCYSTGTVSWTVEFGGGLIGYESGGRQTACFWDIETSGWTTSADGTGKTTAEMKTLSTFTNAGWDFIGETANGTEDTWTICEGKDYPKLTWQFFIGDFDDDRDVDFADYAVLTSHWLESDKSFYCGTDGVDLTIDNKVNFNDLLKLTDSWLTGR